MPRWFTKNKYLYPEPERFTPSEARARRLAQLLERERRFQELPNFRFVQSRLEREAALSRVAKNILNENPDRVVKGSKRQSPKAASIAAALSQFTEKDFSDPAKRKQYRLLRQAQSDRKNVPSNTSDKRRFDPTGKDYAKTIAGTSALVSSVVNPLRPSSWTQQFVNPMQTIPCVQRLVRREVMFAKKSAGHGYRTPKRRTWASGIPC